MQEVVVVGGGIAGAAVALELADRGAAVTVVDAERPGAAATGASAGMLAPQYESMGPGPLFDLLVRARSGWADFADRILAATGRSLEPRFTGMLVANRTAAEESAAREDMRWQRAAGHSAEIVDIHEARTIQPDLPTVADSFLWLPDEGRIDSQALPTALPAALDSAGVRVIAGARVAAVTSRDGRTTGVRMADGRTLSAGAVVLAAGAWSDEIDGLPRDLTVRPVRGHMLRFPAGAFDLRVLLATHEGRYLVPRADGTVLAGSTMEDVGFDRSLSDDGIAAVRESAGRLFPPLASLEPTERWADLRPLTADGLPILGPDPDLDGLAYATGYGRNGILLGPLAGAIVADLVSGTDPRYDWSAFAPERLGPGGPAMNLEGKQV